MVKFWDDNPISIELGDRIPFLDPTYVMATNKVDEACDETDHIQMDAIDIGLFVGDLSVEDDASRDDLSFEGLQQELEECKEDDVVANILSNGTKLRDYTKGVEINLRQVELDSIQDYIKESDNLVSLHDQIHDCDGVLSQMEALLSGFQTEIGSISSDIRALQEKSVDMDLKLKNRKVAESKLAKFVEDIIVPPWMIDVIVDGEVNDDYMRTLLLLSRKLKFVDGDHLIKTSEVLKDVQPELDRLRQKAALKVFRFFVQKLYVLRKPKTNIQILQQSVLLKYKSVASDVTKQKHDAQSGNPNAYSSPWMQICNMVLASKALSSSMNMYRWPVNDSISVSASALFRRISELITRSGFPVISPGGGCMESSRCQVLVLISYQMEL
ncbi:Vacuolar protein sorting-associated protein 52 [Ancistrocladus abbreviatus]